MSIESNECSIYTAHNTALTPLGEFLRKGGSRRPAPSIPCLVLLILLLLAPIFYGLKVWIKLLGGEEIEI